MFRPPIRFNLHPGAASIELRDGEQVVLSENVRTLERDVHGLLVLTDQRFLFEPADRASRQAQYFRTDLPLDQVTVLDLRKPLLGGTPLLRAGTSSRYTDYWMPNATQWLEAIQQVRQGGAAPIPPPPPPDLAAPAAPSPSADSIALPPCPVCGSILDRMPDGSLRCLTCNPEPEQSDPG